MRYDNLDINFSIADTTFHVISLSHGTFDSVVPAHAHSIDSFELHYITSGKGTLIVDDISYPLYPHCLYVTGPLITHTQIPDEVDPMAEYNLYLNVTRTFHSKNKKDSWITHFLDTPFWIGTDRQEVDICYHRIFQELETVQLGFQEMVTSLFQQIILLTTRNYDLSATHSTLADSHALSSSIDFDKHQFLTIERCFLSDYATISLSTLSETLSISPRQTQRILKHYYGQTFQQKKQEARMSAAVSLLHDNTLSLAQIAEQLGYSSKEHFSNAFSTYYHMAPGKFRKK